jgi:agmatine deiminase
MRSIKLIITTVFSFLFYISIIAQGSLPIWMTPEEQQLAKDYDFIGVPAERGITTPPEGNLRTMAEWEQVDYLLVTWVPSYSGTLTNIVAAATQECKVLIITPNPSNVESVLQNSSAIMDSVEFLVRNYNTIWIRDYAANSVYKDFNDSLILVDWIYNRPRPLDNSSPSAVADQLGIPLYQMTTPPTDVIGTGGNFMSDGFGTAFSSKLILDENGPGNGFGVTPKTEADIDQIFSDFMGISNYIKMENLPYDDIDHIDMHMKLLDEETLLVSEYPPGVADGPQIEANIQYVLNNHMSVFGTPFKLVRIVVPPSTSGLFPDNNGWYRTYTNSVFVNNTLIVPYYREEYDTIAERILKEALPGYKIVGVNVDTQSGEQLIAAGGAIHCITHSVGTQAPLIIRHQPLEDTHDNINPYQVTAFISHRSGIANATLHYKLNENDPYLSLPMIHLGNDNWSALIPAQQQETEIFYYIEATANSGKKQNRPMPAPDGYWKFKVFGDGDLSTTEFSFNRKAPFPNPASAITAIPFDGVLGERGTIGLYDATGRMVQLIHEGDFKFGEQHFFFQAQDFAKGTYSVIIRTNERTEVHPIVIF